MSCSILNPCICLHCSILYVQVLWVLIIKFTFKPRYLAIVACLFSTFFQFSFLPFIPVPRPHLSFEAQLVAGKSHDLAQISCPKPPDPPAVLSAVACGKQKHEAELKFPRRIRRLNIFPASKMEVVYILLPNVVVLLFFTFCFFF